MSVVPMAVFWLMVVGAVVLLADTAYFLVASGRTVRAEWGTPERERWHRHWGYSLVILLAGTALIVVPVFVAGLALLLDGGAS